MKNSNNKLSTITKEDCIKEYNRIETEYPENCDVTGISQRLWEQESNISKNQIFRLFGSWGQFKAEMEGAPPANSKYSNEARKLEFEDKYVYNKESGLYIFLLFKQIGKNLVLPAAKVKSIISSYSNFNGEPDSINQIAIKFNIPRQYLTLILGALGATHDSLPVLDEELLGKSEEETVNELLQTKKSNILEKLTDKDLKETQDAARKYWEISGQREKDFIAIGEHFKEMSVKYKPIQKFDKRKTLNSGKLLELAIPDLHLGKQCWAQETGNSYDINITCELYKKAVSNLIYREKDVDKILFVIGNDFFNCDTILNTTTTGTPQDEDTRWQKTFNKGCDLLVEVIDEISQIADTQVLLCQGNHGTQREYYLAQYIKAWYRENNRVEIDGGPKLRKYFQWGKNLIGFDHGDQIKHKDLPLVMASEVPEMWAATKYKSVHIGHFHFESLREINGVKVRILPSLSATDAWHNKKGYIGNIRAAEALIYDKELGLQTVHYYNVV